MANRLKEDEKNERIIRNLLKQPANRKCINCNSLGPQYVCTTLSTFICTTCSGIHREFTHRVKSVSMAKFTAQEVSALQAGGNERAKEIYFKELDAHRQGPDSSNVDKLRDFIKHVYVDRRYTGDRSSDKPPRAKMGDREEPYDSRRSDSYHSGSRSPPYADTYERQHGNRSSPGYEGRRSPGYDLDNQRHSDYGRSPVRSAVVNDWKREDRFTNGRRSEEHQSSEGESGPEGRSPDSQKANGMSIPPIVRPVREILGDSPSPVRVIEPVRVSSGKIEGPSQPTERTASSSNLASSNGNPSESNKVDSLIDFDIDPKLPATGTLTQPLQPAPTQPVASSTTSSGSDNWACFDKIPEAKAPQIVANANPLESMLTQLTVPAPTPAPLSGFPTASADIIRASSVNANTPEDMIDSLFAQAPAPTASVQTHPSNGLYVPVSSNTTMLPNNSASFPPGSAAGNLLPHGSGLTLTLTSNGDAQQSTNMQNPEQFLFPSSGQGVSTSPVQVPETGVRFAHAPPGVTAQASETKSSGRKELPADIFTVTYPSYPVAAHGWQTGLYPGMGYQMQYNTAVPMPTFPPAKSMNPFDLGGEAPPSQPTTFPSMTPLQAALPNMAAPTVSMGTSSINMISPSWVPPQPAPYPSFAPQVMPLSGTTSMSPSTYMGQQIPSNLPPSSNQVSGSFGYEAGGFGSLNVSSIPNQSGNPFG